MEGWSSISIAEAHDLSTSGVLVLSYRISRERVPSTNCEDSGYTPYTLANTL